MKVCSPNERKKLSNPIGCTHALGCVQSTSLHHIWHNADWKYLMPFLQSHKGVFVVEKLTLGPMVCKYIAASLQ